jgi:hypothetical protein
MDQDGAGQVLLVNLEQANGQRRVTVEPRTVGKTRFRKVEIDAASVASQADLGAKLREHASPDLVLDARLVGVRGPELDVNMDELERQLASAFMRVRVRDASVAALDDGLLAPADTVLGAFVRDYRARIDEAQTTGDSERAAELREALRLGTSLLDDPQRVTLA